MILKTLYQNQIMVRIDARKTNCAVLCTLQTDALLSKYSRKSALYAISQLKNAWCLIRHYSKVFSNGNCTQMNTYQGGAHKCLMQNLHLLTKNDSFLSYYNKRVNKWHMHGQSISVCKHQAYTYFPNPIPKILPKLYASRWSEAIKYSRSNFVC